MKDRRFRIGFLTLFLSVPVLAQDVKFTDITAAAGIKFTHNAGKTGKKWLPETMGSGAAFFDADGDGWLDILLINSKDLVPKGRKTLSALYRNNKNGTFTDITAGSGLDVELYGFGVAVADYDNDGKDDLYITALNGDRLFHNEGGGKFRDVTKTSGIANSTFSASSAWLDYDKDGKLDLFIGNYVAWTAQGDVHCSLDGKAKSYCTPESYKGVAPKLYRNLGLGKFQDVTVAAGLNDATNKALGIGTFDYDGDGWTDIFVANDGTPNKLYHNLQNGKFKDEGMGAGIALGEDGKARGAMGVDFADYDRSGRMSVIVGNFSNQMIGLYHNEGSGLFMDMAPGSSVGRASQLNLTFGLFFFDYDLDGYPDFLAANGHIEDAITKVQPKIQFAQLPLLMRNAGRGKFDVVNAFSKPIVARGSVYGDFDKDGDLDVLLTTNDGTAYLYRNDGGNRNNWLQVKLVGKKSNRNGIGAIVRVTSAGGKQWQVVHSGSSYLSSSDLALTFGLGKDTAATSIEVEWPSGVKQKLGNTPAKQTVTITEQ